MSEFFVYYKNQEDLVEVGQVQAVTSTRIKDYDLPFVKIPAELGKRFNTSQESVGSWHVKWNPAKTRMEFIRKGEQPESGHMRGFRRMLEQHETNNDPDIVVTWHRRKNVFTVTGSELVDAVYKNLDFFVTRNCDPNVLHFGFEVSTANIAQGTTIPCNSDLPEDFSIFTMMCFDNYLLRKEQ